MSFPHPAARHLHASRARLATAVRRRYPSLCPARVEDAVSDAILAAVQHPARFEAAVARDGAAGLWRLAACVARRAARDQIRRHSYGRELGHPDVGNSVVHGPGQEFLVAVPRDIRAHLGAVARGVSPRDEERLTLALLEKLEDGSADTEIASRHQLRREYVNRAWRQVVDGLF